jgi:UDP-N-acetylglucosamine 2-epimerase (non-hydrolysing)
MDKLIASSIENQKQIYENLERILNFDIRNFKYILVTGHRRENFGEGLIEICDALKILSLNYPRLKFVFPVHLNPNVQRLVHKHLNGVSNCHLISPLKYDLFLFLMKHCFCVLTDSGGIQEEAPAFKKPVLVTRDVTERQEGVVAGAIKLVGSKRENVILNISRLIEDPSAYEKMSLAVNPYGDGMASLRITDFLAALKV